METLQYCTKILSGLYRKIMHISGLSCCTKMHLCSVYVCYTRVHETQVHGLTSTSDSKPHPERAALATCDHPSVVLQ